MLVSVTRLRVRSLRYLPEFLWYTFRSRAQVERASGFCGGRLLVDSRLTFWTLTAWDNERSMKAFRGAGAHSRVMPKLFRWCDEAAYAHWLAADDIVPDWRDAHAHLQSEGRLSRVAHPSSDHNARRFPEPRLQPLIGNDLKRRSHKEKAA